VAAAVSRVQQRTPLQPGLGIRLVTKVMIGASGYRDAQRAVPRGDLDLGQLATLKRRDLGALRGSLLLGGQPRPLEQWLLATAMTPGCI